MSIFSKVAFKKVPSNTFDLTHQKKMSAQFGELTPSFIMDVVPGDTVNLTAAQLVRFAPLAAPLMHQVSVYQHYFFVPNRILWDNWENFITGGEDGLDASVPPTIQWEGDPTADRQVNRLGDLLGLPINNGLSGGAGVDALPFAAYQEIYNEYYRDQNLITAVNNELIDGNNSTNVNTLKQIRKRAWQHDYFTSALPWTQKGPEATIPLGTTAPLLIEQDEPMYSYNVSTNPPTLNTIGTLKTDAGTSALVNDNAGTLSPTHLSGKVDLSNASASSINDLRRAFRLQEWLEKNARGGSRYIESILVHFGVKSSDARLQRPEYLGGGATPVQISEVLQTSQSGQTLSTGGELESTTPQGNMAGHGISAGGNQGFKYYAEEHGYLIGILSVMPKTAYQQGIPKMFFRKDKFDYYWPEFANIGEQPILNQELYYDTTDTLNQDTFGYTPRYSEYKYLNDTVHGDFRTDLDFWHMGRKFTTRPVLDQSFIQMDSDEVSRVFAVTDTTVDQLYIQINNNVKAKRKMPVFGIPTI